MKRRKGIALPIVFGVILCFGVWVGSLSWTMTQSRHRYTQIVKLRRAYFLGRSALQHFFLKVKTLQRSNPRVMDTLYNASNTDWNTLSSSFIQDIAIPSGQQGSFRGKYGIASFSIDVIDKESPSMAIRIVAFGNADGAGEKILRTYKVSR